MPNPYGGLARSALNKLCRDRGLNSSGSYEQVRNRLKCQDDLEERAIEKKRKLSRSSAGTSGALTFPNHTTIPHVNEGDRDSNSASALAGVTDLSMLATNRTTAFGSPDPIPASTSASGTVAVTSTTTESNVVIDLSGDSDLEIVPAPSVVPSIIPSPVASSSVSVEGGYVVVAATTQSRKAPPAGLGDSSLLEHVSGFGSFSAEKPAPTPYSIPTGTALNATSDLVQSGKRTSWVRRDYSDDTGFGCYSSLSRRELNWISKDRELEFGGTRECVLGRLVEYDDDQEQKRQNRKRKRESEALLTGRLNAPLAAPRKDDKPADDAAKLVALRTLPRIKGTAPKRTPLINVSFKKSPPLGSSKAAKYATEDIVTDQPDESSADAALKLRDRLLHTWVSNKELRTLCDDRGLSHAGTNEKLKERLLADGPYAQLSHQELAELCHERGVAPSGNMENRIARLAVYDNLASNFTTSLHSLRTAPQDGSTEIPEQAIPIVTVLPSSVKQEILETLLETIEPGTTAPTFGGTATPLFYSDNGELMGYRKPSAVSESTPDDCIVLISITRLSGGNKSHRERSARYRAANEVRARFYFEQHHRRLHQGCQCRLIIVSLVLVQSSNGSLSASREMLQLRKTVASTPASVPIAICTSGTDGLSTNMIAMNEFFSDLDQIKGNIDFFIHETDSNWAVFPLARITSTVQSMTSGHILPDHNELTKQLTAAASIGVSKELIAQAKRTINSIQPKRRNDIQGMDAYTSTTNRGLFSAMAASSRPPIVSVPQKPVEKSVVIETFKPCQRVILTLTDEAGQFHCPDTDCKLTGTIKDIRRHLTWQWYDAPPETFLTCPFCNSTCGHDHHFVPPPITAMESNVWYTVVHSHLKQHHFFEITTCERCQVAVKVSDLDSHLANTHGQFTSEHLQTMLTSTYTCASCMRDFVDMTALRHHFRTQHVEEKVSCSRCEHTMTRSSLAIHDLQDCQAKAKEVTCSICHCIIRQTGLLAHMKQHWLGEQVLEFAKKIGMELPVATSHFLEPSLYPSHGNNLIQPVDEEDM